MTPEQVTCVVCGKPVESIESYEDILTQQIVLRAYCHGAVDEMWLNVYDIQNDGYLKKLESAYGVAFVTRQISDSPDRHS